MLKTKKKNKNNGGPTAAQRRAQSQRDKAVARQRSTPPYRVRAQQYGHLSDCARLYVSAIEDPFNCIGACIPSPFAIPSQKVTARARGVFTTGTNGYGAIVVCPKSSVYNDAYGATATGPKSAIIYTDTTYAGTTIPLYSATGANPTSTNSPFSYVSTNSSQLNTRVVSAGLRIRNVTPQLNRGGIGLGIEEPAHSDLQTYAMNVLYNLSTTGGINVDGAWNTVRYHPVDADELEYLTSANGAYVGPGTNQTNSPWFTSSMAFIVAAPNSTAQTYEWEYVVNFEAIGRAAPGISPTDADPNAMAVAANLFRSMEERKPVTGDVSRRVTESLKKAAKIAMELTGGYVARKVENYLKP